MIELHLTEVETQLDEFDRLDREVRERTAEMAVIARKVRARIRAIRRLPEEACTRGADGRCATHCPEN